MATTQPTAPKHTFAMRLDATLPKLMADRDKITQVVTNLANTATLGNVDPNSLANPFTRGAPGTLAPAPFATTSGTQGFHRGR